MSTTLIAGVGNIFLGDDAFGVEVAQRLSRRVLPADVQVVDFGIRAIDLGYALQDGHATTLLVDVVRRGGVPGTLYVIEPEPADDRVGSQMAPQMAPHDLSPDGVLAYARAMGGAGRIILLGCEPQSFGDEDDGEGRMGLSDPVDRAADEATALIESWVWRMTEDGRTLHEVLGAVATA